MSLLLALLSPASSSDLSLGAVEGADVLAASTSLVEVLELACVEGADTSAGTVGLAMTVTGAAVEGADVFASNVSLLITASMVAVEGADVMASAMDSPGTFSMAATEGADVFASAVDGGQADNQPGGYRMWNLRKRKKREEIRDLLLDIDTNLPEPEPVAVPVPAEEPPVAPVKVAARLADHTRWVTIPVAEIRVKTRSNIQPLQISAAAAAEALQDHYNELALRLLLLAS